MNHVITLSAVYDGISTCMFCRSLFVLLYFFFLAIVLSVLPRYTDSDYPFGILKTLLNIVRDPVFGAIGPIGLKLNLNLNFWCLTPLSAIFQLYHGDQF